MLTLIGRLALLPIVALPDWLGYAKRLPPHEQDLARAGHGATMIALPALAVFGLYGARRGSSVSPRPCSPMAATIRRCGCPLCGSWR